MTIVGTRVGHILIEEQIGRGGMGEVYRGLDEALQRRVAVKAIRSEHRMSAEHRGRFLREARLLSRLDHPSICRVFDLIEGADADYLVLEYIEGRTLRHFDPGELSLERKLAITEQVAGALAAAHAERIVHRDLKPENVMITEGFGVKVLDFGIARSLRHGDREAARTGGRGWVGPSASPPESSARETQEFPSSALEGVATAGGSGVEAEIAGTFRTTAGIVAGTAAYMSPEQARGEEITEASDLYSLGVMLQELVTSRPAYDAEDDMGLLVKVSRAQTVPLAGQDPDVAELIADLESLDPRKRPTAPDTAARIRWVLDRPARLRRRRIRAAVTAVVGAALVVAVSLAVASRVQARRQALLAQRFGQQVERVEGLLWREESLPRHDMRPARQRMRERLAAIEDELRRAGHIAEAPGHAALGRGFLALGEPDEARRHLEAAWSADFRTPETAYALGLTLGQLYQRELQGLNRIASRGEREAKRKAIEAELKEPALGHLRASVGAEGVAPEHVRALLAFHEGRHREAVSEAQAAFARVPWLWEAKVVEGNALMRMGRERYAAGAYDEALASYGEARRALGLAARISESAQQPQAQLCGLGRTVLMLEVWGQGRGSDASLVDTVNACNAALEIDPDSPLVHTTLAETHLTWAQHLLGLGVDPLPAVEKAIASGVRAVELAPQDDMARRTLGLAWWQRGNAEGSLGRDASASLFEAARHEREAVTLNPRNAFALSDLGLIYQNLGRDELVTGKDPRASLRESIRFFEEAVNIEPNVLEVNASLGGSYWLLANALLRRSAPDTGDALAKGLAAIQRAVAINPSYALALKNRATLRIDQAEWERRRGGSPVALLDEAVADLKTVLAAAPDDAEIRAFLAAAYLVEARLKGVRGALAKDSLIRARSTLAQARELGPTHAWVKVIGADLAAASR